MYVKQSNNSFHHKSGYILIQVVVLGTLAAIILGGLAIGITGGIKATRNAVYREQALQIAEAGAEYYRWHLAHAPEDYTDGTDDPGPYVHDFFNKDGEKIGEYSLSITEPPLGSSVVTVRSTGYTLAHPEVERTIKMVLAIPSLARFAVASNAPFTRFGEGTVVTGKLHSNGGIQFDGIVYNTVSSSAETVENPDTGNEEYGVHTHVGMNDPLPPSPLSPRQDVFTTGREFPVPPIDFEGITTSLAFIKTEAQASGNFHSSSGGYGYLIILKVDDTYDLYKVTRLRNAGNSCYYEYQEGWDEWSYASGTYTTGRGQNRREVNSKELVGNFSFPTNGLIFVEDNLWIEGQINGARLTIAAAEFPDTPANRKNIIIDKDILYTNYDSSDVIGLIAQNNINIGLFSEDDLRIDAALVAQYGRVGRYYYKNNCNNTYLRDTITVFGMIATNQRYGFSYASSSTGERVSGYANRDIQYDGNLLYSPPPYFPLTSDTHELIRWEEE